MNRQFLPAVVVISALLGGCETTLQRDPMFQPSYPALLPETAQAETGAIFQRGHEMALFQNLKARRIGDLLTIRLVESTNATKSASSSADRSQSTSVSNPTLLGSTPQFDLPVGVPLAGRTGNTLETELAAGSEFEGSADSSQSNSLSGSITVTVADVFPNGYLYVRGEKRLTLNQGNEYVKIAGIIRPVDILPDNSVPSTKIADATIIYAGDGAQADANRMGWLARFFMSPIFPF